MADTNDARPDFRAGVLIHTLPASGMLLGRVDDDDVLLAQSGDEWFAVGAHCTHYHGPLAEGLRVGDGRDRGRRRRGARGGRHVAAGGIRGASDDRQR